MAIRLRSAFKAIYPGRVIDEETHSDWSDLADSVLMDEDISTFGRTLIDDAAASDARTTLGLGTMATQAAADFLALAGGTMTGPLLAAAGSAGTPSIAFAGASAFGFYFDSFFGQCAVGTGGIVMNFGSNTTYPLISGSGGILSWATLPLAAGGTGFAFAAGIAMNATGVVEVNDGQTRGVLRDLTLRNVVGQTGYSEGVSMTAPGAGAASHGRTYYDAGGAGGKMRLMAIFPSGAAQVIALEP